MRTLACVQNLEALSDAELAGLLASVRAEVQRRAIDAADPQALAEHGFREGFRADGLPRDPWIMNGVLVCPGSRIDKSATSHDCGFVRVDDEWVWETESKIDDIIRKIAGRKVEMRSVTLVAVMDGMTVDLIYATARTGVHKMKSSRSFVVNGASLELVSTRTPNPTFSHR